MYGFTQLRYRNSSVNLIREINVFIGFKNQTQTLDKHFTGINVENNK